MAELAQNIRLVRRGAGVMQIFVNGEPFPWHCTPDVQLAVARGDLPAVTLTILADHVEVDDDVRRQWPDDGPPAS